MSGDVKVKPASEPSRCPYCHGGAGTVLCPACGARSHLPCISENDAKCGSCAHSAEEWRSAPKAETEAPKPPPAPPPVAHFSHDTRQFTINGRVINEEHVEAVAELSRMLNSFGRDLGRDLGALGRDLGRQTGKMASDLGRAAAAQAREQAKAARKAAKNEVQRLKEELHVEMEMSRRDSDDIQMARHRLRMMVVVAFMTAALSAVLPIILKLIGR